MDYSILISLLRFASPFAWVRYCDGVVPYRFRKASENFAGVVISCILCDLRNGLCAPDKLYGSLFQTVFLDIVVYWHTVDLFEHFCRCETEIPCSSASCARETYPSRFVRR